MPEALLVTLAAGLAGCIDAIVGGGGLILLPALFSVYPQAPPATLLGSNKGASVWGTAWATVQYARRVEMPWSVLLPAALVALGAAFAGAWAVTRVSPEHLRNALPWVLGAVFLYTLSRRDLGRSHRPVGSPARQRAVACAIAAVVGFYDGFFGPGTGSFFVFLFVRLLGFDFLHASAGAKLLNAATNIAALALFGLKGHVWWHLALPMAVANVAGSIVGARLALQRGAGFVRAVFIAVVGALILKTAWDAMH